MDEIWIRNGLPFYDELKDCVSSVLTYIMKKLKNLKEILSYKRQLILD